MQHPWFLFLFLLIGTAQIKAGEQPTADQVEFFEKKIRPVLVDQCVKCHSSGPRSPKGGLKLENRSDLLRGGDSGPTIVTGKPDQSKLIEAISYKNNDLQMPPKGKLPESVVSDFSTWIKMGAPWPGKDNSPTVSATKGDIFDLVGRKAEHWCWKPVQVNQPPVIPNAPTLSPIDRFILAKLQEKGLKMADPADRRTLIRRVTFDLIGLPPRVDEINAFLNDQTPDAFARVVDRLLASPHFGERWGRHWLDLVRYGESRGHEFDPHIANAWQYRDYVIRALNADVPYNQMVLEHLAGDLLPSPRMDPKQDTNESIIGTGFWFLGEEVHSPVDIRADQADRFDNKIDVMTKTFLGLTVSCARCHDHKFDAISARDYYSLFAFLESSNYRLSRIDGWKTNRRVASDLELLRDKSQSQLKAEVIKALQPLVDSLPGYLLMARESISQGVEFADAKNNNPPHPWKLETLSPNFRKRVVDLATSRKLDPKAAERWTLEILNASHRPEHWLHIWAKICDPGVARDPSKWNPILIAEKQRLQQQLEAAKKEPSGTSSVIIDYRKCSAGGWLPDDVSFGSGPRPAGMVEVDGTIDQPMVRFNERSAAVYDRIWDRLELAPQTQNDAGSLGSKVRAGRTIRTPAFGIEQGQLWYLVRGSGSAYAAVGQHIMIAGPLHGGIVQGFGGGPEYHWVGHNLSAYKGLKTHIEFTADPGSPFAVAMVVQGDRPPGIPYLPSSHLLKIVQTPGTNAEELSARLAEVARGAIASATTEADLQIINRLVAETIRQPGVPENKPLFQLAQEIIKNRDKLAQEIHAGSRLAMAMQEGTRLDGHVFVRGSYKTPGETTGRRFLEALAGKDPIAGNGSGRLELAQEMLNPAINPLVGRVMVNRIWQHLFGQGLVGSVDNFGVLGEKPTHPELLDYLANRFVHEGWSIKKTIRELLLTQAYQMSSRADESASQLDPQNVLLHHRRVRRLEGEVLRDSILALSGRMDFKMGGSPVPIYLTPFLDGRGRPGSGPLDGVGRRSIYLSVTRNFLSPMMLAFDTPSPFSTVGRRTVSNVPAQALILLNDPFIHGQTEIWAKRILQQNTSNASRIDRLYEEAFARPPAEGERQACEEFLEHQAKRLQTNLQDPRPWADLVHALLNVKEFYFLQ